jgi:hypothetical protein
MKGALTFLLAAFVAAAVLMVVRDAAAPASVSAAAPVAAVTAPVAPNRGEAPAASRIRPAPESVEPLPPAAGPAAAERNSPAALAGREPGPIPEPPAAPAPPAVAPTIEATPAAQPQSRKVVATYFHGKVRCATCRRVEAYAREAVEEAFGPEIAAGNVEFRAIDVEEPQNRHFIRDYHLVTRSVVVSEEVGGAVTRWVRLDQVWALVGDRNSYLHYIQDAVHGYLEIQ